MAACLVFLGQMELPKFETGYPPNQAFPPAANNSTARKAAQNDTVVQGMKPTASGSCLRIRRRSASQAIAASKTAALPHNNKSKGVSSISRPCLSGRPS